MHPEFLWNIWPGNKTKKYFVSNMIVFAYQLTLFEPGKADLPNLLLLAPPPCFFTFQHHWYTPVTTLFISGLKSRVLKLSFLSLKMMVKSGLEFILKLTEPLQNCSCPVQKYLPRMAELAWQLSRYIWRGWVNFKINSRPLFAIIFKLKNDNFKTQYFSPLIERVLAGVLNKKARHM